jgi:hypothetical protein
MDEGKLKLCNCSECGVVLIAKSVPARTACRYQKKFNQCRFFKKVTLLDHRGLEVEHMRPLCGHCLAELLADRQEFLTGGY